MAADFELWHQVDEAISSRAISDLAIEWLDEFADSEPLFLYLHFMDPHFPYETHPGFDIENPYRPTPHPASTPSSFDTHWATGQVDEMIDHYHEEVAFTDSQIGRVLDHLRERDLDRGSLVVVTADHGEGLMRRGEMGHGSFLYQELVHVTPDREVPRAGGGRKDRKPRLSRRHFSDSARRGGHRTG